MAASAPDAFPYSESAMGWYRICDVCEPFASGIKTIVRALK